MGDEHLDHSGVRHWTDMLARTRFGVQLVAGKKITSATVKAVGNRMASYADYRTGNRVRPGAARLAVDLEMDYHTVRRAITVMRDVGLLRLVRSGGRSGDADEYQLVIPADLLDRDDVEVWSPAQQTLAIEHARLGRRGASKSRSLIPQGSAQDAAGPVDNPDSLIPGGSAQPDASESITDPCGSTETRFADPWGSASLIPGGSATTHGPTTKEISQPVADVDTAVTAARASPADTKDPIPIGQGPCRRPGCAKGWVLDGDQLARCECNRSSPGQPEPPPRPPNGTPNPSLLAAVTAGHDPPESPPAAESPTPQLRLIRGGLAA